MHQVFRIGPYAAQNTENRLDEGWASHQPAIHEVGQIVKVAYVVALELETCAVVGAPSKYGFDIFIGILENQISAVFQMLALPLVFEILEALKHGKEAEEIGRASCRERLCQYV